MVIWRAYGPHHVRIYLQGLCPGKGQTSLLKAKYSKFSNYALQKAKNEGADQAARIRAAWSEFVVHMHQNEIFLLRDPYFCGEIRNIRIWISIPLFYGHESKSYQS